jgi:hypothetical protein
VSEQQLLPRLRHDPCHAVSFTRSDAGGYSADSTCRCKGGTDSARGRLAGCFLRLHEPEVCAAAMEEQELIVRQGRLELDLTLGEIFAAE